MATLTITEEISSNGILKKGRFEDVLFTSAGAATYLDNTLVARDTSTLKIVPFVKGGTTDGNGVVYGILTKGFSASGAGDTATRVMLTGEISKIKTVIHADGDSSNIDGAVKMTAKDTGIVIVDSVSLHVADNS